MARKYPDKWVFMVTHHVDPRLPKIKPLAKFNVGYFGEPANVSHYQSLGDIVDFHPVDTKESSTDWLDQVGDYNLHYAVRNSKETDGTKPFLKGFTAPIAGRTS